MTATTQAPLIVLAAGGTGGHVFPAEALATEILARGWRLALVTDRRGQAYQGTLGSLDTHRIRAGGIAGLGWAGRVRGVLELGWGAVQAYGLLRRLAPKVVVGFGGYASVPTVAAAVLAGIPTVIHEQNAVLGRANRLLAPKVTRIATCYDHVAKLDAAWTAKTVRTGMPVRPAVAALHATPYAERDAHSPLRLLVLGGSQGARVLSEVIPAAVGRLAPESRARLQVAQQCRPEDLDSVRAAYAALGVTATLDSFFHDVPARLADAHLVVARSGASTVAELTVVGRPAILVPYPHAIDDHQTANAHAIEDLGGAWLMPQHAFTAESLAQRLDSLLALPGSLSKAAACAQAAGLPTAAAVLADTVAHMLALEEVPS